MVVALNGQMMPPADVYIYTIHNFMNAPHNFRSEEIKYGADAEVIRHNPSVTLDQFEYDVTSVRRNHISEWLVDFIVTCHALRCNL